MLAIATYKYKKTLKTTLIFLAVSLGASLFLSGCSSVSSLVGGRHKYDYAQNFESMLRYNFNPALEKLSSDPDFIFIKNSGVTLSIENGMAAKKLRKERNMTPDFWLNYYFTGENSLTVSQLNELFGYNLGLAWDDEYGSGKGIANGSHSFSSRTLIIDLVSRTSNRLIWRGSVPTSISPSDSESSKREALNDAVEVILDPFPPQNKFESLKTPVFDE